jgi:hypothetical protein
MRAAFRRGVIIVTAALCAGQAQAQAQSGRSDDQRPAKRPDMSRPSYPGPMEAPGAACQSDNAYRLTTIAIGCAHDALRKRPMPAIRRAAPVPA